MTSTKSTTTQSSTTQSSTNPSTSKINKSTSTENTTSKAELEIFTICVTNHHEYFCKYLFDNLIYKKY